MALKHLLGGLALVAVTVCSLPITYGFGAAPNETPGAGVNRSGKGDRLVVPISIVVKRKVPVERLLPNRRDPVTVKETLMNGCEPMFSPVTVPSAAHISGRCVG